MRRWCGPPSAAPSPYVFVDPIPYGPGTDAGAQAIRLAMEALAADPAFRARVTASTDDLNMDGVVFGAGGHMDAGDAALVAGRAVRAIAAEFAAYALPGSRGRDRRGGRYRADRGAARRPGRAA